MGFDQSIIVSSRVDEETKQRVISSALAKWPFLYLPRKASHPDHVVLGAMELNGRHFQSDAEYDAALEEIYSAKEQLPAWSNEFKGISFVFIRVDCFGGTCLYSGLAARSGEVLAAQEAFRGGHTLLLRHVGIETYGLFAPFSREYFQEPTSGD